MPYKCCAPGCKSGYKTDNTPKGISFYKFPDENSSIFKLWIKSIPRKNWNPNKHSKICSKHFNSSDIVFYSQDEDKYKQNLEKKLLIRPRLKPDAVPIIFNECPSYVAPKISKPRTNKTSASERLNLQQKRLNEEYLENLRKDLIKDLPDLYTKIESSKLPDGIHVRKEENIILFFSIDVNQEIPGVGFSMKISKDLSYSLYKNNSVIDNSKVMFITPYSIVKKFSEVLGILDFLKDYQIENNKPNNTIQTYIDKIQDQLYLLENDNQKRKMEFGLEQLKLSFCKNKGFRYSQELITMAMKWQKTNSCLYKQIISENILSLPSEKHLKRISRSITPNSELSIPISPDTINASGSDPKQQQTIIDIKQE